jgi:hypothetical protein
MARRLMASHRGRRIERWAPSGLTATRAYKSTLGAARTDPVSSSCLNMPPQAVCPPSWGPRGATGAFAEGHSPKPASFAPTLRNATLAMPRAAALPPIGGTGQVLPATAPSKAAAAALLRVGSRAQAASRHPARSGFGRRLQGRESGCTVTCGYRDFAITGVCKLRSQSLHNSGVSYSSLELRKHTTPSFSRGIDVGGATNNRKAVLCTSGFQPTDQISGWDPEREQTAQNGKCKLLDVR